MKRWGKSVPWIVLQLDAANPSDFGALLLPGELVMNPDNYGMNPKAVSFW
jgi:hypothetical protein